MYLKDHSNAYRPRSTRNTGDRGRSVVSFVRKPANSPLRSCGEGLERWGARRQYSPPDRSAESPTPGPSP